MEQIESMDVWRLKRRAKRNGFELRKHPGKPYDAWFIVDTTTQRLISPGSLDFAQVTRWLDNFEQAYKKAYIYNLYKLGHERKRN